jgi:hypothetical protein
MFYLSDCAQEPACARESIINFLSNEDTLRLCCGVLHLTIAGFSTSRRGIALFRPDLYNKTMQALILVAGMGSRLWNYLAVRNRQDNDFVLEKLRLYNDTP